MKKLFLLIAALITTNVLISCQDGVIEQMETLPEAYSPTDPTGFDDPLPRPEPDPEPEPNDTTTTEYERGKNIGEMDANYIVQSTWESGMCLNMDYDADGDGKYKFFDTNENGEYTFNNESIQLDRSGSCFITTETEKVAFYNFIAGYEDIVEQLIIDNSGYESEAFYQGMLDGFKLKLCELSFSYPFSYTSCSVN